MCNSLWPGREFGDTRPLHPTHSGQKLPKEGLARVKMDFSRTTGWWSWDSDWRGRGQFQRRRKPVRFRDLSRNIKKEKVRGHDEFICNEVFNGMRWEMLRR